MVLRGGVEMRKAKRDFLEQVAKYRKEEIIEAIGRNMFVDCESFLSDLKYIRTTKAIDEKIKLIDEESAAFDAYICWEKEVAAKYGDGETYNIAKLPLSEIERGERLLKAFDKSMEKVAESEKKVSKLLGL